MRVRLLPRLRNLRLRRTETDAGQPDLFGATVSPPRHPPRLKPAPPKPEPAAQPVLIFAPPHGSYTERLSRVMALRAKGTPEAISEVVAALGDEDERIRWLAGSVATEYRRGDGGRDAARVREAGRYGHGAGKGGEGVGEADRFKKLSKPKSKKESCMSPSGEVSYIVGLALDTIQCPYPPDIIDRVCQAIQANPAWLRMYQEVVAEKGRHAVNSTIGRTVLQRTGLSNSGIRREARCSLIDTYTELQ